MAKALFLDRDGVVNEEVNYAHRPDQIRFVEGIFSLCRQAKRLGYHLVVVTNQAGIARGMYTEADFDHVTAWIGERFREEGVELDATLYCPFHPEHGVGEYKRESNDRKPSPGMLRRAAATFGLDLSQSIMIGDRCTDVGAANAAGLRQAFLITGTEATECAGEYVLVTALSQVEDWLRAAV